jgi:NCS2 family nucleobase:cation symporter-2
MIAIANGGAGIQGILHAVIAPGILGILIAPVFAKLVRFFPPVVTGSVTAIIGVALLPGGINWTAGGINWAAGGFGSKSFGVVMIVIVVESLGMFLVLGDITGRPANHDSVTRGPRA